MRLLNYRHPSLSRTPISLESRAIERGVDLAIDRFESGEDVVGHACDLNRQRARILTREQAMAETDRIVRREVAHA